MKKPDFYFLKLYFQPLGNGLSAKFTVVFNFHPDIRKQVCFCCWDFYKGHFNY